MGIKRFTQNKSSRNIIIKILVFAMVFMTAIYLICFTPVRDYFTADKLGCFFIWADVWGPFLYVLIYAVGVCLFVPGTLLTSLGIAVFGTYWGFLYVWTGAMLGASIAFFISRILGRDLIVLLIGEKLKKYDKIIYRNGFVTVLYLRLVYFPFTLLNFGMGLTRVRFWEYFMGTGLGIIAGTSIFIFFIGTLKEVWVSGNWEGLLSFKSIFSMSLFVFSFCIPVIIKKIKGDV